MTIQQALKNIQFYKKITSEGKSFNYLRCSQLRDIELLNSFKLDVALRYFNTIQSDGWLSKLKYVASHWDTGYAMYSNYFKPDIHLDELDKFTKLSEIDRYFKLQEIESSISTTTFDTIEHSNPESTQSFLSMCISIGRDDKDYWHKIYNQLKITQQDDEPYINKANSKRLVATKNGYEVVELQYYF